MFQGLRGGHQGGHRCPHWSMMTSFWFVLLLSSGHTSLPKSHCDILFSSKKRWHFSGPRKTQMRKKQPKEKTLLIIFFVVGAAVCLQTRILRASSFSSCWLYCEENYTATNTSALLSLLASWTFFSGSNDRQFGSKPRISKVYCWVCLCCCGSYCWASARFTFPEENQSYSLLQSSFHFPIN